LGVTWKMSSFWAIGRGIVIGSILKNALVLPVA
jgi:hypothetical protein